MLKSRALYAVLAAIAVVSTTGCGPMDRLFCHHWGCGPWGGGCDSGPRCNDCGSIGHGHGHGGGCSSCGVGHGGLVKNHGHYKPDYGHHHAKHAAKDAFPRGAGGEVLGPAGPPTGQVTYPYYTTRGPRDFLVNNPGGMGP